MEEKKYRDLSDRLYDLLDTYELRDTETTPSDIYNDLLSNPVDIIEYLVEMLEA